MKKIFRQKHNKVTSSQKPTYKLMTKDAYADVKRKEERMANKLLQMPPVVKVRAPIDSVLSRDPALQGYDEATYIFTDITQGVSDRDRIIVVREPDGTLRHASWEIRDQSNNIYNPKPFVKLIMPKIFLYENLRVRVFQEAEYEHVLNFACLQFDVDDSTYQRVVSTTYEAVDANRAYDMLHSTCHFGPMCFYFAWHKQIDNILIYMLDNDRLMDAVDLVKLYHMVHSDSESVDAEHTEGSESADVNQTDLFNFITAYAEEHSLTQPYVLLALKTCEENIRKRNEEYLGNIQKQVEYAS